MTLGLHQKRVAHRRTGHVARAGAGGDASTTPRGYRSSAATTSTGATPNTAANPETTGNGNGSDMPFASHRFSIDTDTCPASAASATLTPAAKRNHRSVGPPGIGTNNDLAETPTASATACKILGLRGRDSPRSHNDTRSPPASPATRAS